MLFHCAVSACAVPAPEDPVPSAPPLVDASPPLRPSWSLSRGNLPSFPTKASPRRWDHRTLRGLKENWLFSRVEVAPSPPALPPPRAHSCSFLLQRPSGSPHTWGLGAALASIPFPRGPSSAAGAVRMPVMKAGEPGSQAPGASAKLLPPIGQADAGLQHPNLTMWRPCSLVLARAEDLEAWERSCPELAGNPPPTWELQEWLLSLSTVSPAPWLRVRGFVMKSSLARTRPLQLASSQRPTPAPLCPRLAVRVSSGCLPRPEPAGVL